MNITGLVGMFGILILLSGLLLQRKPVPAVVRVGRRNHR